MYIFGIVVICLVWAGVCASRTRISHIAAYVRHAIGNVSKYNSSDAVLRCIELSGVQVLYQGYRLLRYRGIDCCVPFPV